VSDSVWPHRPTRFPHPWNSPGKNTGVGCHFLLQCMKVKSESEVVQSCPTLRDTMDCSLPASSVHGTYNLLIVFPVKISWSGWVTCLYNLLQWLKISVGGLLKTWKFLIEGKKKILIFKLHGNRMICPNNTNLALTWYSQFNN